MSTETKPQTGLAIFPNAGAPSFNVVPVALIQPTPREIEIFTPNDAGFTPSPLADLVIEPVQQWVHLPVGEDGAPCLVAVACTVCYSRYNTPGTPAYRNQAALTQCLVGCT